MKRKTLQEQYNLIKEGKGHEGVFMNDAKRQFPNVVRNAAALSETINSLKKHHIITDPKVEVAKSPDFFKLFKEAALSINENQYKKGDKLHTKLKNGKEFDVIFDSYSSTEGVAYGKIDGERKSFQLDTVVDESLKEAKAIEKKTPKEVLDLEDKNYQSDGKDDFDDIYGEEFELGIYAEMSDPKNEDKSVLDIKRIVAKNIRKDSLYYVKDGQFGIKGLGYTDEAPGLKASKSDQMEKVKLDESTNPENLDKLYSDNQSWSDDIDNLQKIKNNLSSEEKKRFKRLTPNDQKTFEKIMRMMDDELEESLNGDKKWSSYEQRMVNQIKAAQKEKRGMYTLPMKTQDFYRKHKDIFNESVVNEAEQYITDEFKVGDKIKTNFGEWEVIETDYKPGKSFTAPFIFKGKDMKRVNIPNPPKTNKNAVGYKVTDGNKYPIIGFLYQYKDITKLATVGVDESVNEAKFTKKSLMRAMKTDDGIIQLGNGKEYVIYNPNNGNDDNADMWQDKVIFGLDQDGGEHEIEYSDIVSFKESEVNEATDMNDPVLVAYRATSRDLPKLKIPKLKSRRLSFDKYMDLLDARLDIDQQIKDLRDEMAQTLRDMEQEAEPEGGEVADRYGSTMMSQEKEYTKLMAKKDKIMARIDKHRMA